MTSSSSWGARRNCGQRVSVKIKIGIISVVAKHETKYACKLLDIRQTSYSGVPYNNTTLYISKKTNESDPLKIERNVTKY